MSCGGGEEKQWSCGQAGAVNLQRVTSIVRDMGEPCLSQSPVRVFITVNRMLKPDKWQATFDGDGKVSGFQKALKSIVLGGVDPSIRPEVWEFLLGCYALGSTAEYRRQLRMARRERYKDLIKQCQTMHSSIGTGALAYVVGSKVMDMRTSSKDDRVVEAEIKSRQASIDNTNRIDNYTSWNTNCTDTCFEGEGESSCDSAELVSVRESTDSPLYDSSWFLPISSPYNGSSSKNEEEACGSQYAEDSYFDFPPLPVTDLFAKSGEDEKECCMHDNKPSTRRKLRFGDDAIHSFEVNNNVKLVMESSGSQRNGVSRHDESELELNSHNDDDPEFCHDFDIEAGHSDSHVPISSIKLSYEKEIANRLRISNAPETSLLNATTSQGGASEDRVSEWLWTLHRIVVDVVRTDSHLEFYEDKRNLARMSDILAVYAWVDPATGYCQGMSDLLSPFVVLFEDNADAFWCFEMLLRRMRDNFQMEGPTGVMKQLQALWHILELTDREMFYHLSHIGAESLHFAFRMLMVLFRRELSFSDALRMWEMMWAVDFDESVACDLEENCLEALMLDLPKDSVGDVGEESTENGDASSKDGSHGRNGNAEHSTSDNNGIKPASAHHFCGLTRNFWSRSECMPISPIVSSTKNGNDELPVFCVAAILIMNHHKIIRETQSIDDMIKIFNDKLLKIHVRRCIRSAIKLRKKYFYKLIRSKSPAAQIGD